VWRLLRDALRHRIDASTDGGTLLDPRSDRPTRNVPLPFIDALPTDWIEPGETATVDVDGRAVAIANVKGEYFAFDNQCPHQATPLGGLPLMRDCLIRCPQHGSVYDVRSGKCVLPSDDGFCGDLPIWPTRVVDAVVQVEL
jgi:3-phenylpropionate/trans-cinnamate dioxygenase ferredoxin subunit